MQRPRPAPPPLRRSLAFVVTLAAAAGVVACSHDATGPRVARVLVTPADTTVLGAGATLRYEAKALDARGTTVAGVAVSWSTSDTGIATISPAGVLTAAAAGTVRIMAKAGGVTGSASLAVTSLAAPCSKPTTVDLAPGAFATWDAATCLLFPSLLAGDRYRVAVTRPLQTASSTDTATVRLAVTSLGSAQAPSPRARGQVPREPVLPFSAAEISTLRRSVTIAHATERFESRLRSREAALVRRLGAASVLPVPRRAVLPSTAPTDLPATLRFDTATTCTSDSGKVVTGVLIHQDSDFAVYQDSAQHVTKPVTAAEATRLSDYYSTYARSMITAYFGANPDVDGNGKLIALVSPVVAGDEAGFVWVGNFYPDSTCPASNQRDMMFLNADLIRSMDDPTPSWQALPIVAHEAKHVVSLYDRLVASRRAGGFPEFQPEWVEEGTAEIAGEMSSRIAWAANGGPAVGATVTLADFSQSGITPSDYGVLIRMARTVDFLWSQPNGLVVAPAGADSLSNIYGSGWHFHRWLGDAYGHAATPLADSSLFRALTDSLTPPGAAGLSQETGKTFGELLDEFIAAICLNGTAAPAPARGFTTYDFPSATLVDEGQAQGRYPWPVTEHQVADSIVPTQDFSSRTYVGPIGPSGVRIHDLVATVDGEKAQIRVAVPSPATIVVVRLR